MQKNGSSDSYIIISLDYYSSIKVKAGLYSFEMFCIELQQLNILLWINLLFILLIE